MAYPTAHLIGHRPAPLAGAEGGGGLLEVCWAMWQVRGVQQDLPCDAG